MTKPKRETRLRQVATFVPEEIKSALERKAAEEKKTERRVVTEALTAHLRTKGDRDDDDE